MAMTVITVKMPPELIEAADLLARRLSVTRSEVIRAALVHYIALRVWQTIDWHPDTQYKPLTYVRVRVAARTLRTRTRRPPAKQLQTRIPALQAPVALGERRMG